MKPKISTLLYGHIESMDTHYGVFQVLSYSPSNPDVLIVTLVERYINYYMPIRFVQIDFNTSDLDIAKT